MVNWPIVTVPPVCVQIWNEKNSAATVTSKATSLSPLEEKYQRQNLKSKATSSGDIHSPATLLGTPVQLLVNT